MKNKTKHSATVCRVRISRHSSNSRTCVAAYCKHFPSSHFDGTVHELYRLYLVNSLHANEVSAHVAT